MAINQQPLIGMTTYGRNSENGFSLPALYVDSVRRAGGIPLLITPGEENLEYLVDKMDGIVFTGGGDLDPNTYNGNDHEKIYNIDHERDAAEFKLAEIILATKTPTLAICRGLQIINTILGGTLFDHIPDHFGETIAHRHPPKVPSNHKVIIEKNSDLFSIIGRQEIDVASWHHQSIDRLADGLNIVAQSADNIVEAVEIKDNALFIGVQWHPELTALNDPSQQKIFETLMQRSMQTRFA
jgi:putative glutamine amidotransferase